jgi:hypothetical protein
MSLLAIPAEAQGNWRPGDFGSARLRVGLFEPDGDSEYWDDTFDVFTGRPADFEDYSWAFDYVWRFGPMSGIMFTVGYYDGGTTQAYRDWVDEDGYDITHTTSLEMAEINAAWVFQFARPNASIQPYVGVGGGFVQWELMESGYFIDFGDEDLPVVAAHYTADGSTMQWFLMAGAEVPLGARWSFVIDGRWKNADDELGDAFAGFGTIDLSGTEYSAGFAWKF